MLPVFVTVTVLPMSTEPVVSEFRSRREALKCSMFFMLPAMAESALKAESARSEPQLSIVMPVYNAMPYLPKAVHDVLYQTGVSLELLAVDDGSNDGSFEFLQQARRTGWHCS